MGFYGDFLKVETSRDKIIESRKNQDLGMQLNHESAIADKKIAALDRLTNSLERLSVMINIHQPTILCVSINKDTNPKDLNELIEKLK